MKRDFPNSAFPSPVNFDPVAFQIEQEIEEFLRDLALEFPFQEIFETLRRHEFQDRYGHKIIPIPHRQIEKETVREIRSRVDQFLTQLRSTFGKRYLEHISTSFRYYTQTTRDN